MEFIFYREILVEMISELRIANDQMKKALQVVENQQDQLIILQADCENARNLLTQAQVNHAVLTRRFNETKTQMQRNENTYNALIHQHSMRRKEAEQRCQETQERLKASEMTVAELMKGRHDILVADNEDDVGTTSSEAPEVLGKTVTKWGKQ